MMTVIMTVMMTVMTTVIITVMITVIMTVITIPGASMLALLSLIVATGLSNRR